MSKTETFDFKKAVEAQKKYCKDHAAPDFAPLRTGKCYRCNRNIFAPGGISVEKAGKTLITGCPYCQYSYVE